MKGCQERPDIFLKEPSISTNMKNTFIEVRSLMDRLDRGEERNSELENKAGEVIQNVAKDIKTWNKVYKTWRIK